MVCRLLSSFLVYLLTSLIYNRASTSLSAYTAEPCHVELISWIYLLAMAFGIRWFTCRRYGTSIWHQKCCMSQYSESVLSGFHNLFVSHTVIIIRYIDVFKKSYSFLEMLISNFHLLLFSVKMDEPNKRLKIVSNTNFSVTMLTTEFNQVSYMILIRNYVFRAVLSYFWTFLNTSPAHSQYNRS